MSDKTGQYHRPAPGGGTEVFQNVYASVASAGVADAVTVNATATLISAANAARRSIEVYNGGPTVVYLGYTAGVTAANGMPLPAGTSRDISTTLAVYGIAGSGTQEVRIMTEEG